MSKITGASSLNRKGRRFHTAERVRAIAPRARDNASESRVSTKVRYNVESEHTSPNSRSWEANASISAHDSPPPVNISIVWTNTRPRS